MSEQILDDEANNYIVWAKRNKVTGREIQSTLAEQGMGISESRISQVWRKYKKDKNVGKYNPYEDPVESDESTTLEDAILGEPPKNTPKPVTPAEEPSPSLYMTPIDLKPILTTAGLRPPKVKQIVDTFALTEGTWEELQKVLDIANIQWHMQKAILAHSFGPQILEFMEGKKPKMDNRQPQDINMNISTQANQLLQQKLAARQNLLAVEEAEHALESLDRRREEDTVKTVKDILALKLLAGDVEKKDSWTDRLIMERLLEGSGSKDLVALAQVLKELRDTRGEDRESETFKLLQAQVNKLTGDMQKQALDYGKTLTDLQLKRMEEARETERENFLKLQKMEKEKLQMLAEQMQERFDRSIRTEDDWFRHVESTVKTAERLGLVKLADGSPGSEKDATKRLETVERLVTKLPENIDKGLSNAIDRFEHMMVKYLEHQDRRELRQFQMQQARQAHRTLPSREPREQDERDQLLTGIENSLVSVQRARMHQQRMRELEGN